MEPCLPLHYNFLKIQIRIGFQYQLSTKVVYQSSFKINLIGIPKPLKRSSSIRSISSTISLLNGYSDLHKAAYNLYYSTKEMERAKTWR